MKGFVILAVISILAGIQASSISRSRKELGDIEYSKRVELPWLLEEQDGISETGSLDEEQEMLTILDVLHFVRNYNDVKGCSGNTCQWCMLAACFKISYLPDSNEFEFCATYRGDNIFCQKVPARNYKYCKTIKVSIFKIDLCIEIMNVNINGGRACMDVKVSAAGMSKTFNNVCLGTPKYLSLA